MCGPGVAASGSWQPGCPFRVTKCWWRTTRVAGWSYSTPCYQQQRRWGRGGWLSSLTAVFYGPWSTFRGYEIDIKMLIFWYWFFFLNSRLYFSMKNYLSNLTFFCFLRAHNLGLCKLYVASQCVANFSRCILTAASPWKMNLKTWHKKGSSSFWNYLIVL